MASDWFLGGEVRKRRDVGHVVGSPAIRRMSAWVDRIRVGSSRQTKGGRRERAVARGVEENRLFICHKSGDSHNGGEP